MEKIFGSVLELIGNTPLVRLSRIEKELGLEGRLLAKLERQNPGGSAKDRVALGMLRAAEREGRLQPGATVIEPTSGNTGVGLALAAAVLGYRVILTMPDTMSAERRKLLAAYGAELVLTPGAEGMNGAVAKANELLSSIPGSILAGQFDNPENPRAHYETTGPELWTATGGNIDAFVAGIGTGGTLSGTARYLKEQKASVLCVGVEPAGSPLITEGRIGKHDLQGIGANFIPANYDPSVVDEVLTVTDVEAYGAARLLAKKEGLLAGITSGAAVSAAVRVLRRDEMRGRTVAALLPDTGERYLSTALFSE